MKEMIVSFPPRLIIVLFLQKFMIMLIHILISYHIISYYLLRLRSSLI